jgi:endonuclease/exonuclease/phosphatase family metal-dependent hydrolase
VTASVATAEGGVTLPIKFMTFNVKAPGWNPARLANVVAAIQAEAPDVLALEEANSFSNGPQLIAALAGDYDAYLTTSNSPLFLRQGAMLSVLGAGIHALPSCTDPPMYDMTWLKLSTPEGVLFDIYGTHLCVSFTPMGGGDPAGNAGQAADAAAFIAANTAPGTTFVFMGDLNANQTSNTIAYLVDGTPLIIGGQPVSNPVDMLDTWEAAPGNGGQTHPGTTASGGQTALDWILAGPAPDVTVSASEVITFVIAPGSENDYSDHLPVVATLEFTPINPGDPWVDLGQGLAGSSGVPVLVGSGALAGGDPVGLDLSSALAGSSAHLVLGLSAINASFKGGTLVPDPAVVVYGLPVDGAGELDVSGTWPAGVPAGAEIYCQYWIVDPAAIVGFAASNAVVGTTP